jgi:hypothetical protein
MRSSVILWVFLVGPHVASAKEARPRRPVHTYSIVARDAATGQLGVAVQSHWVCFPTTSSSSNAS